MTTTKTLTGDKLQANIPVQLPATGTAGRLDIDLPFTGEYVAILNDSQADIYVAAGHPAQQPADALKFGGNVYLSTSLTHLTDKVTLFWTATADLGANNKLQAIFSNVTIPVQGGTMARGGVASSVDVVNTPSVTVVSIPDVTVSSTPAIQGSDYATPAANHTAKVDSTGLVHTAVDSIGDVTIANTTLANAGIIGETQITVGTAAVEVTLPAGCRSFAMQNLDTTNPIYLGSSSAVTTATGYPVQPKQEFGFDVDPTASGIVVWAIAVANVTVATIGVK